METVLKRMPYIAPQSIAAAQSELMVRFARRRPTMNEVSTKLADILE